ncbi:ADP-forming succinate--CoA ligase subunit beta [Pelagibius litoralis]|uniref:Succinate--CoA ligase [ADP-forming] subunit beta n=1 Tax=Pelagibius litoralis TaxID=374515 RepID=A0A967EXH9_9PROT|nr:ADP-forming succinate--CoA ligase subunit beta [Pelagibius litoralis]NIA69233.1 ADP-forming succinate--CoA ligase subunit beta [Pelagibius litoralis]
MNLHEYQAKELLSRYGVPSPKARLVRSVEEAAGAARDLGGASWAVKAQIHAGLRHDAGGVRMVSSPEAARAAAEDLLDRPLVTPQTGPKGKLVRSVYIEQAVGAARELYLAVLVDRSRGRVSLIAAREGGNDIEGRMAAAPGEMLRLVADPEAGLDEAAAGDLAARLGLDGAARGQAVDIMKAIVKAFGDLDASLIEINPLALTNDGQLTALDVKMVLDDNALFRHQDLAVLRDEEELDPTELEAQRFALNYVHLDGNIGVMVNGAGLALATVDLLKQQGGEPADFMDIRPEATRGQVDEGFRLLLRNRKINAILVNIYGGGILRCDTVAEGIAAACKAEGLRVPLIVRAAGTNGELARKILKAQGIPVNFADSIGQAASMVVAAAGREAA